MMTSLDISCSTILPLTFIVSADQFLEFWLLLPSQRTAESPTSIQTTATSHDLIEVVQLQIRSLLVIHKTCSLSDGGKRAF